MMFLYGDTNPLTNLYVYNNIFLHTLAENGVDFVGPDTVRIYNNTFYGQNQGANGGHVIFFDYTCEDVELKNNIFYGNFDSDDCAWCGRSVYIASQQNHQDIDADYNLHYQVDSRMNIVHEENVGGYAMAQFTTMQSAWSWEANSPTPADPLVTDGANNDVTLTSSSPAIGAGTPISFITTDYLGNARDATNPDIGAYEYVRDRLPLKSGSVFMKNNNKIMY